MDMRARGSARATAASNERRRIDDDGRVCEYEWLSSAVDSNFLSTFFFCCFLVNERLVV